MILGRAWALGLALAAAAAAPPRAQAGPERGRPATSGGPAAAEQAPLAPEFYRDAPPPRAEAPPPEPAVASAAAGLGVGSLLRGLFSLALVLLLILATGRLARAWVRRQSLRASPRRGDGPPARVRERLDLGPRHALAWVESAGDTFLVGFGEGGMSLLGPLPAGPARPAAPAFAEQLARAGQRRSPPSPGGVPPADPHGPA